jgi:hypothetical protein
MSNEKLKAALNKLLEFIKPLENTEEITDVTKFELLISLYEEGTLNLSGEEARCYREILKELTEAITGDIISQNAVERLVQKTIMSVLDIQERRRDQTFTQRLDGAIRELQKSLTIKPSVFQVYYPIGGLATDGLPMRVGKVNFCLLDEGHLSQFDMIYSEYYGDLKEKENRLALIDTIRHSEIIGKPIGLVEVSAIDSEAAKNLALKELIQVLDLINFYSDLIPYQKGCLYLPGESDRSTINVIIISKEAKPTFSFGFHTVGQLMPLSLKALLEINEKQKLGFSEVCKLLIKNRSKLEDRIISALQWSGKATSERRREEAFLLFTISLESLILSDNEKEELTYRLKTRIAHLLGKSVDSRINIAKNVSDLYGIRSRIIHAGSYQVTDANLSLMRYYTKNCTLRILIDEPFKSMNSIESLRDWFDGKILSQVE